MNISQMKINQISELLRQPELPLHIIEALTNDLRPTVNRLFQAWINRKQRYAAEQQRLKVLYQYESSYYQRGYNFVAGIDEAGRGPLAGPVVVAAVILPKNADLPGLNDSKRLSARQREQLYNAIHKVALSIAWCPVSAATIDHINIYQATVTGMYQTVKLLEPSAEAVLIDAVKLPDLSCPWQAIINGDALSASIAAASVIAKVERDRIMTMLDSKYPGYGFAKHKGYGTKDHMQALRQLGPCPEHRQSFEPMKSGGDLGGIKAAY